MFILSWLVQQLWQQTYITKDNTTSLLADAAAVAVDMLYSLLSWVTHRHSSDAAVMQPLLQVELTYGYHTQPETKWIARDLHAQCYKWPQLLHSHYLQNVVLEGLDTPSWLISSLSTVQYDWATNTYLLYNVVLVSAIQQSESSLWIYIPSHTWVPSHQFHPTRSSRSTELNNLC